MDRILEQYITSHSTPQDPLLEELYRETHIRFINPNMLSGHLQGLLLEMISKMIRPELILEIGTFTGYSAICLAKGLNKGGKLITIELNDELESFSRGYFERAGLSESITQLTGKAQEIIPELNGMFDLVFIDGDKREYCEYFRLIKEKVRKGGFILADNVLWGGKALENDTKDPQSRGIIGFNEMISTEPGIENLFLPFRDGLMIIRKL
jgi:caffeoyl-CoA O-methyltransferase